MTDAIDFTPDTSNDRAEVSITEDTPERHRQLIVMWLGKATDLLQGGLGGYYDCNPNSNSQNGCR